MARPLYSGALLALVSLLLAAVGTLAADTARTPASGLAWVVAIDGPIGPATADFVSRQLRDAPDAAAAVVLRIDTPGGLEQSMRTINQAILASPIPVIGYVAPAGARAASAGTYILYATNFAAMAPATNVGAATPVSIGPGGEKGGNDAGGGDTMTHKMVNDAVAYIRSLAELRGRNPDWAEKAVRESVSLSAEQALADNVIDAIEPDLNHLLRRVAGQTFKTADGAVKLPDQPLTTEVKEAGWRDQLLATITNPNVAYILMLVGIYGLILEFYHPGTLVAGITGAICLLLAMYAFQVLPVSYTGFALILLGIALMVAEAIAPSFGMLGFGGIAAFAIGSMMLMDTESPAFSIALPLIAGATAASALVCIGMVALILRSRRRPVVYGAEALIGEHAEALEDFDTTGRVRVEGEIWQARVGRPVAKGQLRRIIRVDGLRLILEDDQEKQA